MARFAVDRGGGAGLLLSGLRIPYTMKKLKNVPVS